MPISAWEDVNEYTSTARVLVQKFQDNFKQYDRGDEIVKNAGPTINSVSYTHLTLPTSDLV